MGIKTYEEIEKYLEVDSRTKKEDKKGHQIYESCGLGGRLNRFLKFGMEENNEIDANEKEKDFIKTLDIPRSTYYDIKKRITKELLTRKESKGVISKNITSKYEVEKETADGIIDFVINLNSSTNNINN